MSKKSYWSSPEFRKYRIWMLISEVEIELSVIIIDTQDEKVITCLVVALISVLHDYIAT